MGTCFICDPPAYVPDERLWDHALEVHKIDVAAELQRWPDGKPVVVDESLEPEDFR
jgi:hypothetical protein